MLDEPHFQKATIPFFRSFVTQIFECKPWMIRPPLLSDMQYLLLFIIVDVPTPNFRAA